MTKLKLNFETKKYFIGKMQKNIDKVHSFIYFVN